MQITQAVESDSKDIWMWRNDAQTRAMSITTAEVSWADHDRWFQDSCARPDRFLYIGRLSAAEKVGMCRFDISADAGTATVSINLNPQMRGKKLSYQLLDLAIKAFWATNRLPLAATIRKQNASSIHCFGKCGFILDREDSDYNHYLLKP